jgi:hypothetical protein
MKHHCHARQYESEEYLLNHGFVVGCLLVDCDTGANFIYSRVLTLICTIDLFSIPHVEAICHAERGYEPVGALVPMRQRKIAQMTATTA